ncbi:ArsR family transcriptional regulator [Haloarcula sp. H-GB4]|uniref:ArsR family transcriptional regulator n=1 Tax=Haloarcula sp. H-GB4 TaxID=3069755 RepID=UPI0027B70021|nr:ArsR family transcriptional regulator [Haloarcula sp. H-GB4]MDQ2074295.1 ArsR family transcriptional regulator [Haloarcula sp. H-GB4]
MSNTADDGRADGSPPSTAEFTPERVLSVFQDRADQAKPLTATDVMDALGCSRKTAHNKLDVLVERGDLETRKVGARSRVWWIPFSQLVGSGAEPQQEREPPVEHSIADADLPGTGDVLDDRRAALRAAYDYLRENPDTDAGELITEVFQEHPAGYKTADEWWDAIGPALEDLPQVDLAADHEHVWHYVGG